MALAILNTTVTRPVTDKRIATDVMKSYGIANLNWWTTVRSMSYPDPVTNYPRIRPRIGSLDLLSNGAIPFKPTGFDPAVFDDPNPTNYLGQSIPSGGASIVSLIISGQTETGFTEAAGLCVDGSVSDLVRNSGNNIGFRLSHNNAFGIIVGSSILNRFSELPVALGEVVTIAVFMDLANKVVSASKNGGAFTTVNTGMSALPASTASNWFLTAGAQQQNNKFDGDLHEIAVLPGVDIRNQSAFLADFMAYRRTTWGQS